MALGNDVIHGGDGNDSIDGGGGNDTLFGEGGNDFFPNFGFSAAQSGDGGAGNDRFWAYLQSNSTITTGADSDTIQLFNVFGQYKLAVTDFAAGSGGDVLDINSVLSNLIGWDGSTNPFATGFLRLVQNGSDTDLQWDRDNATGGAVWTTFVTLQNVTASSLTQENFAPGYPPDGLVRPTINSNGGGNTAGVSVAENTTAVTIVTATNADAGQTPSYSISGGADAAKFAIGSNTGALRFIIAPKFELPTDAGGNNVYDVIVQASDGHGGMDTQAIAITVTDVNEPPSDTTAPVLQSISLSNTSLNVGAGQTTLSVTARFTDNLSGIFDGTFADGSGSSSPQVRFVSPSGQFVTGIFEILHPLSGDRLDGEYQATVTLGANAEAGLWHAQYLLLNDEAGNSINLSPANSAALVAASFTVTNGAFDTTAPVLKSISIDGSFRMSVQDVSNQFPWSQQESSFDPQSQIKTALVRYDDGSVQGASFDAVGNQPWASQNSVANAAGQTTNLGVIYDDHTQQTAIFDTTGQLWTSQNAVYDAQGRQTTLGVIYDDGHTEAAVFDADGSQPWTSQSLVFDAGGQLIATSVTWDDGHVNDWHII